MSEIRWPEPFSENCHLENTAVLHELGGGK